MPDPYDIAFDQVHFRTMRLTYTDRRGTARAHFEASTLPGFDWIGAEPDFEVSPERLREILPRIEAWAKKNGVRLKIWRQDQLGFRPRDPGDA